MDLNIPLQYFYGGTVVKYYLFQFNFKGIIISFFFLFLMKNYEVKKELSSLSYAETSFKMAAAGHRKRRTVVELLFLEGENVAKIYSSLVNIYAKASLDLNIVR